MSEFPTKEQLRVMFAHVSYQLAAHFAQRELGVAHFQVWDRPSALARIGEAHVVVISGLWGPDMLERATQLRYIQVPAAGYEKFDLNALSERGIRLTNGRGVAANAVAEHALGLMLSLSRQLHIARDHQRRKHWRAMHGDLRQREQELAGKRLLIYGLGAIGSRLATIARALGMQVTGIKRDITVGVAQEEGGGGAHQLASPERFISLASESDFVVLTCPLTPQTHHVVNRQVLASMPSTSYLVNVARGACVDEAALVAALERGEIAGAGIDTTATEPLESASPLWDLTQVVLTPHTGGETQRYEDNVIDLLTENLARLWREETELRNQIL